MRGSRASRARMTSPVLPQPTATEDGATPALRFPLYKRAQDLGVLDGHRALIIAATATGKSYTGREGIGRAVEHGAAHRGRLFSPQEEPEDRAGLRE
jgi:hypothetical protein